MTITEMGALGEFFGAIAVAITLVFLVIQVRHSTGLIEGTTRTNAGLGYHNRTIEQLAFNNHITADAELARIWYSGCQGEDLNESERIRFELLCNSHWTLWRGSWNRSELLVRQYYERLGSGGNYTAEELEWELRGKPGLQMQWREKIAMEEKIIARLGGTSGGFAGAVKQALERLNQ